MSVNHVENRVKYKVISYTQQHLLAARQIAVVGWQNSHKQSFYPHIRGVLVFDLKWSFALLCRIWTKPFKQQNEDESKFDYFERNMDCYSKFQRSSSLSKLEIAILHLMIESQWLIKDDLPKCSARLIKQTWSCCNIFYFSCQYRNQLNKIPSAKSFQCWL